MRLPFCPYLSSYPHRPPPHSFPTRRSSDLPHAPNLTANEVNLLHRLWLRFSDAVAPLEMHHHDVVHFALEEVQKEVDRKHTSELQSPMYLVCRLLLEKKKKPKTSHTREQHK